MYDAKHSLVTEAPGYRTLVVGTTNYPLPIPIVRDGLIWYFDSTRWREEIINRRIGKNELGAIAVCRSPEGVRRTRTRRPLLPRRCRQVAEPTRPPPRRLRSGWLHDWRPRRALPRISLQAPQSSGIQRAGRREELSRQRKTIRRIRPHRLSSKLWSRRHHDLPSKSGRHHL
jgi:hypothetical protein